MKLLCGASLALALAMTAPAAADDVKVSLYYPVQDGATWSYKSGESKFALAVKGHTTISVAGQAWDCAHVETTQDGKVVGSEDVSVQDDGVYRVKSDNQQIEPPVLILKLPPAGDAWNVNSKVEPKNGGEKQSLSGKFTEAADEKATAGGVDYTGAVVVSCNDLDAHGAKYAFKTYYVKDVGMVKQEITAGGLTVTLELEKDGYKAAPK